MIVFGESKDDKGTQLENKLENGLVSHGSPTKNQQNGLTHSRPQAVSQGQLTDLSAPVRAYTYQPPEGAYKLALKFKKPADKEDIILVLRKILSELEDQ